jgi:hypothetical protein
MYQLTSIWRKPKKMDSAVALSNRFTLTPDGLIHHSDGTFYQLRVMESVNTTGAVTRRNRFSLDEDGKLFEFSWDKRVMKLKEPVLLQNGDTLQVDGTVNRRDGSHRKLHKGEVLRTDGSITTQP